MTTEALAAQRPQGATNRRVGGGLLDPKQLWRSLPDALRKLSPFTLWRNPVMFIVEIGSVFTTLLAIGHSTVFAWSIVVWLWLTVVFANLAEAVAEGRGKAQAAALRRGPTRPTAPRGPPSETGAPHPPRQTPPPPPPPPPPAVRSCA